MKTYCRQHRWLKKIDSYLLNNIRNNKDAILIAINKSEKAKIQRLYPDIKTQVKTNDEITYTCDSCGKIISFGNKCKGCRVKEEIEKTKKNHEDFIKQLDSKEMTDSIKDGVENTIEHEEQYQKEFRKRFVDNN